MIDLQDIVRTSPTRHSADDRFESSRPWKKAEIAELSASDVSELSADDLKDVVRMVNTSLPQPLIERRIAGLDRPALERLAFLARRCCRSQGY